MIELEYSPTEDIVADRLTKALSKDRHWKLARKMRIQYRESTSPSPVRDSLAEDSKSGTVEIFRATASRSWKVLEILANLHNIFFRVYSSRLI